jgi:hypothetical protein
MEANASVIQEVSELPLPLVHGHALLSYHGILSVLVER